MESHGSCASNATNTHLLMLSHPLVEESGGPAVAVVGFGLGLATLGARVTIVAETGRSGTPSLNHGLALKFGVSYLVVRGHSFVRLFLNYVRAASPIVARSAEPTIIWVNGIWRAQSLAAAVLGRRFSCPYVVRPSGSLGPAALARKSFKKRVYYGLVERAVLRHAAAIHCMSQTELDQLPQELRSKAFVVPSGIEILEPSGVISPTPHLIGVLARVHPIKRFDWVLDVVESLNREGAELGLEIAGHEGVPSYSASLRRRITASKWLANRVAFLGHVPQGRVQDVVRRWSLALLLSEQENFGHSVIAAAATGVPSLVSEGVALGDALEKFGAGARVTVANVVPTVKTWLELDRQRVSNNCFAFARGFGWDQCSRALLHELEDIARSNCAR